MEWWEPTGGLYFWARLPQSLTSGPPRRCSNGLGEQRVLRAGRMCYADDPSRPKPNHEMRLSFGGATEANMRKGIARLGAVFRECLRA